MKLYVHGVLCFLLGSILTGCQEDRELPATARTKPTVVTVNYPLAYFAQRLGEAHFEVHFPPPPDKDPAFWKPTAQDIDRIQQADLILLNGADYAKWIQVTSLPTSKLTNTSASFQDRYIMEEGAVTHTHGPEGEHSHGDIASTIWLDPTLAIQQAQAIAEACARLLPDRATEFDEAMNALASELTDLDEALEQAMAVFGEQPVLASHPVYQYFARRYELNLHSLHWEPDRTPTEEAWNALIERLRQHPFKWMLWEGQPTEETAQRLQSLGIGVIVIEPCFNKPAQGDFLTVMRRNLENLRQAK